jgi:spore maturation protein SpmB
MGSIFMNVAANMLGLDNAATPLGLKAMNQLQELNPAKDKASNSMIMFLVLNTTGLTLIPVSVMVYRAQMGAVNPSDVFIPILMATFCSTLFGLLIVCIKQGIRLWDKVLLGFIGTMVLFIAALAALCSHVSQEQLQTYSTLVANMLLIGIIVFFVVYAAVKRVNAYDAFIEGAKDGFSTAVGIIPYLIAILIAVGIFRASGAMDLMIDGIRHLVAMTGLNTDFVEALPTAMMKPLSGSGARGLMVDAMQQYGADSFVGRLVCTIQGSTDTTLYILAVYFGAVKIRDSRYALPYGLMADLVGIIAAILITYAFFG